MSLFQHRPHLRTCGPMLAMVLAVGCGADYDPPSLVNKLRIIGARAEPPFISMSQSAAMELKVIGHDPGEALCHAWAACLVAVPKEGNYRCFDPRLQVPLGTAPTAKVSSGNLMTMVKKLPEVAADNDLDLGSFGGRSDQPDACPTEAPNLPVTRITILFKVAEAGVFGGSCPTDAAEMLDSVCADRTRCLAGYKSLQVAIGFEIKDCQPALVSAPDKEHKNPVLTGLQMAGVDWPQAVTPVIRPFVKSESVVDLDNAALDFNEGDFEQELKPMWTPESIEFKHKSPDPTKGDVNETLLFSWFTDAGEFKKQRSWDAIPENLYRAEPPDKADGQTVRIWLVVRDGRGGTDWLERKLVVKSGAQIAVNPICEQDGQAEGCP